VTRECGAPLYAPAEGSDVIACGACGRRWERAEWLHLGELVPDPRETHAS
jgi:hypothetical protein